MENQKLKRLFTGTVKSVRNLGWIENVQNLLFRSGKFIQFGAVSDLTNREITIIPMKCPEPTAIFTHWCWFTRPFNLVLTDHLQTTPTPTQWFIIQLYLYNYPRSDHFPLSPLLLSQFSPHCFSSIWQQSPLNWLPSECFLFHNDLFKTKISWQDSQALSFITPQLLSLSWPFEWQWLPNYNDTFDLYSW